MQPKWLGIRSCILLLLGICVLGGIYQTSRGMHVPKCRSISDVVASDRRLTSLAETLRRAHFSELLGDECLSATFFAPTSQAIARSNWGDLASPGPNITGSLLYHLIPFEVAIPYAATELPTALGMDARLLLQPRLLIPQRSQVEALGVVAPASENYTRPSSILDTIDTCEGVVHVIDAVLKPPPDALARAVVYQALQDFGVKGSMTPARRLGLRCRGDGIPRARLRLLVGEKAYREEGPEAGQGAVASQEVPNALEQALTVAKGAAEEHAEADKIMEMRERRKRAEKRKIEREKRQKEQEELESGSLEEDAIDSAEKAMIQAEASQAADLRDARKAFMVAQQLPAPVQERAPHWLASTQFALDKVQEGLASASKADVARVGKIAVAANVAMRLSEAYMAQQLAFTMVKSADWSSALTGGLTLLGNTSIGMEWVFNHQSAQNDVLAAVAKLGRLVALWRKRDQALKDKAAGKDKGRILDQLESMLEKLPESEVQQVYALLDLPIDELRAKAAEERQRSEQGPMKGALGGKKKRKKVEEEVASAQGLLQQAYVTLGEQQRVAGGLQAAQEGKVDLQADTGQAAAQDASAHQPEQGQGQGGASAVVAEAKDAVSSVELQRQRAKKQSRGQQKQQGPHPLLADEPVQDGVKPEQQQGVQLAPGEKATEREAQQQGPHPLLAEEVVESGKKPGQQQGLQLSQAGTLAGEGQHAQQQPQQQQGPHVLLDEKLTEAEEAAAAERMQGIAAGARQDESQQQA
ncbi:hypothetical protein CVIRNUC_000133 [Coccomyxa viridis]|uniref:FAS1 domain-containing protein n=1 Tax=Coccomyxa viridis TaxID=1274662 RepID=A0AAV1HS58_9CHLO|nr:hypothetical protein CVIRNUC_000133 [Coccomyxa viridis]